MAVATSSHRRHYDLKTSLHRELFGLMHHVVTGDQAGHVSTASRQDPLPWASFETPAGQQIQAGSANF